MSNDLIQNQLNNFFVKIQEFCDCFTALLFVIGIENQLNQSLISTIQ